jgi:predicted nucleic acid-binding protein
MIIADTCIWIEYLKGNKKILDIMEQLMQEQKLIAVEFIFAELLQGAKNKRERILIYEFWNNLPKIEEPYILLKAAEYSGKNKLFAKGLSLIDVSIYLLAKNKKAQIWTIDNALYKLLNTEEHFKP